MDHLTSTPFRIALFLPLLWVLEASGQRVGGTTSGSATPADVRVHEPEPSVLQGDVDLFTGRYSASYPLGEVSTPGGLSFALSLNYSPTVMGTNTPALFEGLPYGTGWSDNVPTISVSNASRHAYSTSEEENILRNGASNTPPQTLFDLDGLQEGEGYWYAPIVNIPGVASGRAVFRNFENSTAVFVLNSFEQYVELRLHNGAWTAHASNGRIYEFGPADVNMRMPGNQRTINYRSMNQYLDDPVSSSTAQIAQQKVAHSILPKQVVLSWRCTQIVDPLHLPGQTIRFVHKSYGRFNFYKEIGQGNYGMWLYNELCSIGEGPGNYYFGTPLLNLPMDSCYSDSRLLAVIATTVGGAEERLDLKYSNKSAGTQQFITGDSEDHDDLYAKEVVFSQGGTTTPLSQWSRFLHIKSTLANSTLPSGSLPSDNDPYRSLAGMRLGVSVPSAQHIPFEHGFLESPLIGADIRPYPGDIYEVRTEVQANLANAPLLGQLDINIVSGGQPAYPDPSGPRVYEDDMEYWVGRDHTVFSTFDRAVKWHVNGETTQDGHIVTSNFFMMPFLSKNTTGSYHDNPVASFEGLSIQIGPANSDNKFSLGPRSTCTDPGLTFMLAGSSSGYLSAYRTYAHRLWKHRLNSAPYPGVGAPPEELIGHPDDGALSHHPIARNFGVGLPWSMLIIPGRHAANAAPELLEDNTMFRFWWNDNTCPSVPLSTNPNRPTLFGPDVLLKKVELIRYRKKPMLLSEVVHSVRNGELGAPQTTPGVIPGMRITSRTLVEHTVEVKPLYLYLDYYPNEAPLPSGLVKNTFTLSAIRQAPVDPSAATPTDLSAFPLGQMPTTRFSYTDAEEYSIGPPPSINPCNTTNLQKSAFEMDHVWWGASLLSGVVDPMGRSTTIVYNDLRNRTLTQKRIMTGQGTTIMFQGSDTPDPCDDRTLYDGDATVLFTPTVKELRRSDESGLEARVTSYGYEDKIFKPQRSDPGGPGKLYRETGPAGGDPLYGFKKVTVLGAENGSGIRNKTVHEFHGQTFYDTEEVDLGTLGVMTFCNSPIWPTEGSSAAKELLLFGKLEQSSQYDSQDRLLIRDRSDHEVSLAFENGANRPRSDLHGLPGRNDYLDYEAHFNAQEHLDRDGHLGHPHTPFEGNAYLEWHGTLFPAGPYQVSYPPIYRNSYFIKLTRNSHKEYDPNGCAFDVVTTQDPTYPAAIATINNPGGSGYVNNAVTPDQAALISDLNTYGLTSSVRQKLVLNPLSETLLAKVITVAEIQDTIRLDSVLKAQPALSNDKLLQLLSGQGKLPAQRLTARLMAQPYLSDAVLIGIRNTNVLDVARKTMLLSKAQLSTYCMKALLWPQPALDDDNLIQTFRVQDQLPLDLITLLAKDTLLPDPLRSGILRSRQALPLEGLLAVAQYAANWDAGALEELFGPEGFPVTDTVLTRLLEAPQLPDDILLNIALSMPRGAKSSLATLLEARLNDARIPDPGYWPMNRPDCALPCTTATLVMETITDHLYYEADHQGMTDALAYKRLFGFPEEHAAFRLKWRPSWLPFRQRTWSPQYPGAYTEKESYYYQDLRNRYDRHGSAFADDPVNVDHIVAIQAEEPNEETGVTPWEISDEDGAYVPPPIQCIERMKEFGLFSPLVFQERTISKNNRDVEPIAHNTFHFAFMHWPEITLEPQEMVLFNGPPCTYDDGPPPPGSTSGSTGTGLFPAPPPTVEAVYAMHFANDANWPDVAETLPEGYVLLKELSSGIYYMAPAPSSMDVGEVVGGWRLVADNSAEGRDLVITQLISTAFQTRSVHVQADERITPEFRSSRLFKEDVDLMQFFADDDESGETPIDLYLPLLPYACITTDSILERNMFQQPQLVINERGLRTRFNYNTMHHVANIDVAYPCNNFSSTVIHDPGVPTSIIVGEDAPDPQVSTYVYSPDLQVAELFGPQGITFTYQRDKFGRLEKTRRNGILMSVEQYAQWSNQAANDGNDFITRALANSRGSFHYKEAGDPTALHTISYFDPLGRPFASIVQERSIPDPDSPPTQVTSCIVSGKMEHDPWDRALKAYKPHLYQGGTFNFKLTASMYNAVPALFSSALAEKDPRGRPLFEAAIGENVAAGPHRVKHRYSFLSGDALRCELRLSAGETAMLMPGGATGHVWRMNETEDEDGNISRSYTNSLGTTVATQGFDDGHSRATLFLHDSQGRVELVVDPAKRRSSYRYNLLGQLYSRTTVDGGTTKYLYDISGNVVLEQSATEAAGERLFGRQRVVPTYRRYVYDHFNRLVRQERVRKIVARSDEDFEEDDLLVIPNTISFPPLAYHELTCDPPDPMHYSAGDPEDYLACDEPMTFEFHSGSTQSWLACTQIDEHYVRPIDLVTGPIVEKEWFYDNSLPDLGVLFPDQYALLQQRVLPVGLLARTVTYPHGSYSDLAPLQISSWPGSEQPHEEFSYVAENRPVLHEYFSYNDVALPAWQLRQFNPNRIDPAAKGLLVRMDYNAYDLLGNLKTMHIDVNNDWQVDLKQTFTYDAWGRLREVRAGMDNSAGELLASHAYHQAFGYLDRTKYFRDCSLQGTSTQVDELTYHHDLRDRLNKIESQLFTEYLFYDGASMALYPAVTAGQHWNGRINATHSTYLLTNTENGGDATLFTGPTTYGYVYDDLGRLTHADGVVYDAVNGVTDPLDPRHGVGDEHLTYTPNGNIRTVRRTGFGATPATVAGDHFNYHYAAGTNRLNTVQGLWGSPNRSYTYDGNGNLLTDSHRAVTGTTYGRAQLPWRVEQGGDAPGVIGYLHDAADQRIYKQQVDANGQVNNSEYYLRDASGQERGVLDLNTGLWTWYLHGTQRFARLRPYYPAGFYGGDLGQKSAPMRPLPLEYESLVMTLQGLKAASPTGNITWPLHIMKVRMVGDTLDSYIDTTTFATLDPQYIESHSVMVFDKESAQIEVVVISGNKTARSLVSLEVLLEEAELRMGGATPGTYTYPPETYQKDLVFYVHDHLGNLRVAYTPDLTCGQPTEYELEHVLDYYPYGKILRQFVNDDGPEKHLTTQHERDQETGLDYRGARYYDSDVARFLSLDPLAADYASWNPYNYVLGNPISLIDPDGRSATKYEDENGKYLGDDGVNDGLTMQVSRCKWNEVTSDEGNMAGGKLNAIGRARLAIGGNITNSPELRALREAQKKDPSGRVIKASTATVVTLATNDATGVGVVDDVLIPVVVLATDVYLITTLVNEMAEHRKNARPSNLPKHEEGEARRNRDQGGEKADANRRPPRQRPPNHKGPWPPKD